MIKSHIWYSLGAHTGAILQGFKAADTNIKESFALSLRILAVGRESMYFSLWVSHHHFMGVSALLVTPFQSCNTTTSNQTFNKGKRRRVNIEQEQTSK